MKQTLKLLAVGLLPLAGGAVCYLLELFAMAALFAVSYDYAVTPWVYDVLMFAILFLPALGFLTLWTLVCRTAACRDMNVVPQVALLNAVGAAVFILSIVFGSDVGNPIAGACAIFLFPAETVAILVGSTAQLPAYIIYVLLLLATSTAAVLLKTGRLQKKRDGV